MTFSDGMVRRSTHNNKELRHEIVLSGVARSLTHSRLILSVSARSQCVPRALLYAVSTFVVTQHHLVVSCCIIAARKVLLCALSAVCALWFVHSTNSSKAWQYGNTYTATALDVSHTRFQLINHEAAAAASMYDVRDRQTDRRTTTLCQHLSTSPSPDTSLPSFVSPHHSAHEDALPLSTA